MKILGVDPGFKATGYGCLELQNDRKIKLLETGIIQPKSKDIISNKLNTVYGLLSELIRKYQPDVLVLEKLYAHYKHPATAAVLGHVRGVICLLCAQHHVELVEHSVKRIRKSITGNGNATKHQTQRLVAHTLGIDANRLTFDASDALALALGYIQLFNRKL